MHTSERLTGTTAEQKVRLATWTQLVGYLTPCFAEGCERKLHLLCLDEHCDLLHHARFPPTDDDRRTFRLVVSAVLAVEPTASFVLAQGSDSVSPVPRTRDRQLRGKVARSLGHAGVRLRDHLSFSPERLWSYTERRTFPLEPAARR